MKKPEEIRYEKVVEGQSVPGNIIIFILVISLALSLRSLLVNIEYWGPESRGLIIGLFVTASFALVLISWIVNPRKVYWRRIE